MWKFLSSTDVGGGSTQISFLLLLVLTTSSVLQGVVGVQYVWYACPRIVKLSTPLLGVRVVVFPGPSDRLDTSHALIFTRCSQPPCSGDTQASMQP
jgi:hypothetical protein